MVLQPLLATFRARDTVSSTFALVVHAARSSRDKEQIEADDLMGSSKTQAFGIELGCGKSPNQR